jgi:tellurite resistance protein TerC
MLAVVPITPWHWIAFVGCVLVLLMLDLQVFHRRAHEVRFKEAALWSAMWFALAMAFGLGLQSLRGPTESLEFLTGYLIELSLSMDNIFVIALVFAHFAIPSKQQHRVLFWGVLGALVMRGLMIGVGVTLLQMMHWLLWVCGTFLVYSGIKALFSKTRINPDESRVIGLTRRFFPVTSQLDGQKFLTRQEGRLALTPLALVLVVVETMDLLFAVDSIPAVFAVTTRAFIVFTSNVFAILGLRSLYFVLAGAIAYFRFLRYGLSVVLVFIGVKMLLDPHDRQPPLWFQTEIPISISLIVVGGIILSSILLSVLAGRWKEGRPA